MLIKRLFNPHNYIHLLKYMCVGVLLLNLVACGSSSNDLIGNWVSDYDVEPGGRTNAVSVSVDNMGYFGTGYNFSDKTRYNDWWKYDPDTNAYTQLADFPGVARSGAVAFECGGDIYVGSGYNGDVTPNRLNDFYKYSIADSLWSEIDDFPGEARDGAVAFTVNNKGYVGTGMAANTVYLKDFYCYDPSTSKWTTSTSFGGTQRTESVSFVIDNVAYVVTGKKSATVYDFWKYDGKKYPDIVKWEKLSDIYDTNPDKSYDDDYDDIIRYGGVAFVSGDKGYKKGYVTTGVSGVSGGTGNVTWEYNPSDDTWDEKTGFEGSSRGGAVSFSLNDIGYVLTGSGTSDIWSFDPHAEQANDDNGSTVFNH
ncbi:MAG: galactose oxidase [Prolixibacteraceae bacterium]|nr:galactose oxidase [Prolixibacteraceae bacterium]